MTLITYILAKISCIFPEYILDSKMFGLGQLPPGYDKAVHGPYDPAVFYGKKDLPLSQVKVYQLPAWLARRQFYNPIAWGRACSR